ncbi:MULTISPECIES: hypothetical protein [unclassified Providencia]|uniref:hypothetical protein n=1 Tax=unclassified Providencia TaxID=2633465 RepID=UPI002349280E|nr:MULTISPECIES: hypothetical protein [unclassified Providencia]WOB99064.1 hypothetical protein P3L55_17635 [Providencia sp. PROV046]WOC00520.1 hypothetical protein P3L55_04135 [Providencia sp. PROV046]HEM7130793.1 hypothetical protein [Providencia rettgeri]
MRQGYLRYPPIFCDGEIKIRNLYQYVELNRQRPQQWINRLRKQAAKAPDEIKQLCRPEIFDHLTSDDTVTAIEALVLLTYSTQNGRYQKAIEKIEERTQTYLPIKAYRSKFEDAFCAQLTEVLHEIYPNEGTCTITPQKVIGRYRTDIHIKLVTDDFYEFVIEFDEDAHDKKAYYLLNDPRRDRWFKQNHPEMTYFRVKHSESDIWLNAVRQTKEICSLSTFYAKCICYAVESRSTSRLKITSESSKKAYDINHNPYAFLLHSPKQRMKEIKDILHRLQIEYSGGRSVSLSQSTLNRRCRS